LKGEVCLLFEVISLGVPFLELCDLNWRNGMLKLICFVEEIQKVINEDKFLFKRGVLQLFVDGFQGETQTK